MLHIQSYINGIEQLILNTLSHESLTRVIKNPLCKSNRNHVFIPQQPTMGIIFTHGKWFPPPSINNTEEVTTEQTLVKYKKGDLLAAFANRYNFASPLETQPSDNTLLIAAKMHERRSGEFTPYPKLPAHRTTATLGPNRRELKELRCSLTKIPRITAINPIF